MTIGTDKIPPPKKPKLDYPYDMWTYWRDKKGVLEAIQDYYPQVLKDRPDLATAFHNVRVALGYIDSEMLKMEDGQ